MPTQSFVIFILKHQKSNSHTKYCYASILCNFMVHVDLDELIVSVSVAVSAAMSEAEVERKAGREARREAYRMAD